MVPANPLYFLHGFKFLVSIASKSPCVLPTIIWLEQLDLKYCLPLKGNYYFLLEGLTDIAVIGSSPYGIFRTGLRMFDLTS
jgi:hypothetical protein